MVVEEVNSFDHIASSEWSRSVSPVLSSSRRSTSGAPRLWAEPAARARRLIGECWPCLSETLLINHLSLSLSLPQIQSWRPRSSALNSHFKFAAQEKAENKWSLDVTLGGRTTQCLDFSLKSSFKSSHNFFLLQFFHSASGATTSGPFETFQPVRSSCQPSSKGPTKPTSNNKTGLPARAPLSDDAIGPWRGLRK